MERQCTIGKLKIKLHILRPNFCGLQLRYLIMIWSILKVNVNLGRSYQLDQVLIKSGLSVMCWLD